ncbi:MAG: hypothetical protein COA68_06435 [Oceanobacter sp.]|jgi:type I restriction enzyme S subunit|nr:MAG: hypothetical protein COA68_06435 [Oceanobacter sp.]
MCVEKNVPEIRFKGFSGLWEAREFGSDLVSVQTGTNLLAVTGNSGFPLIKMGNIQRGYFSFEKVERLSSSVEVEKENIANYGDFLFNTRNTLELVGKGATWMCNSNEFAFNNNIARFTLKEIDTIFFNYLYNTQQMIKQVQARAMGTTSVAAIYPQNLKSIKYALPKIKEQTAIGNTFQKLDNLINQHQQKHDKLSNIKKAMLEKMFPKQGETIPEIRFKGFSGEWRETDLADACSNFQSGKFIKAEDIKENAAYPVYGGNGLRGFCSEYNHDGIYALIGRQGALCGNMNLSYGKAFFTEHAIAVKANKDCDTLFLFYKLGTMNLGQYSGQSAQPGLSVTNLIKLIILVPEYREQTQIGNYFQKLDALINKHQQQITKLNNIKQACLSKMFV